MSSDYFIGVDVGTGSVRSAVFDARGRMIVMKTKAITTWSPLPDYYEQSSNNIWDAVCSTVRECMEVVDPTQVRGIGFDATCSLVVLDELGEPLTVSPTKNNEQNIILWMDHRAVSQAERINKTKHEVLNYVGGVISPEMQCPKILWLKENLPATWEKIGKLMDLVDFLTYKATGEDVRSLCTVVCKWTFQAHNKRYAQIIDDLDASYGWNTDFFKQIGLGDLVENGTPKIGSKVGPLGIPLGKGLTASAASCMGVPEGTPVSIGIIDAHAGGLGTLGACIDELTHITPESLEERLALIAGTSACHMAVSREPLFIKGIWGPYFSAMIPSMWLTEGGQSAVGALIDHVVFSHPASQNLQEQARQANTSVYQLLASKIEELARAKKLTHYAFLTADTHVLPYFHGNRSPRADPTLKGMITGLTLSNDEDSLAQLYLATLQAIAYGTRHIIEEMNRGGYRINTIFLTGGLVKNDLFVKETADITGCRIIIPRENEAVLLGSAILGAVASKHFGSILEAMAAMNRVGSVVEPSRMQSIESYHNRKYEVFMELYKDQLKYRKLMSTICSE